MDESLGRTLDAAEDSVHRDFRLAPGALLPRDQGDHREAPPELEVDRPGLELLLELLANRRGRGRLRKGFQQFQQRVQSPQDLIFHMTRKSLRSLHEHLPGERRPGGLALQYRRKRYECFQDVANVVQQEAGDITEVPERGDRGRSQAIWG